MNRHQRRALTKIQGTGLGQAAGKVQEAVQALHAVKDLEALPKQVAEAYVLMQESHAMVSAMVEDYQSMADQVEALKILVLGLAGPEAKAKLEQLVAQVRAQRTTT